MSFEKKVTYEDLDELLKNDNKVKVGGEPVWARTVFTCDFDSETVASSLRYRCRRCDPRKIRFEEEVHELG
jgi:hypothetical protein